MSKIDEILEDRNKVILLILGIVAVFAIIWIITVIVINFNFRNKKAKAPAWVSAATSVTQAGITDGYYVRENGAFYPIPKIDDKEIFYFSGQNMNSVYIINDNKIPILDISTSSSNYIYKGEVLPDNYNLKNLSIYSNYSTGIILNDENVITDFIGTAYDKNYVGYKCEILTPDSLKISDNEVYITDTTKQMKVAFIKGTLYKEFVVSSGFIKGDIYEPYCNGKQFTNLEITKNSYANVLLTEEKYLSTGYYIFEKSDRERYIVKLYNSDESIIAISNNDKILQLNLLKKQKELKKLQSEKKINLKFMIKSGISFYPVTYTQNNKKITNYKIAGLGNKLKLDNDYVFEYKSTQVYGNTRYYLGTVTLKSKEKNAVIDVAISYEDYIACYDYLDYRVNTYVEDKDKDKNDESLNSISDLGKFKGCTYKVREDGKEVKKVVE